MAEVYSGSAPSPGPTEFLGVCTAPHKEVNHPTSHLRQPHSSKAPHQTYRKPNDVLKGLQSLQEQCLGKLPEREENIRHYLGSPT